MLAIAEKKGHLNSVIGKEIQDLKSTTRARMLASNLKFDTSKKSHKARTWISTWYCMPTQAAKSRLLGYDNIEVAWYKLPYNPGAGKLEWGRAEFHRQLRHMLDIFAYSL